MPWGGQWKHYLWAGPFCPEGALNKSSTRRMFGSPIATYGNELIIERGLNKTQDQFDTILTYNCYQHWLFNIYSMEIMSYFNKQKVEVINRERGCGSPMVRVLDSGSEGLGSMPSNTRLLNLWCTNHRHVKYVR